MKEELQSKPASVKQLKDELKFRSKEELLEICLRLSKFKKENKELLTYLLFYSGDEEAFIQKVKQEADERFDQINTNNYYYIKKSIRKILQFIKKNIRFSGKKETEAELLLFFCYKMKNFSPPIEKNKTLRNLFERQLILAEKKIEGLHEDLQFDYATELEQLKR